MILWHKKCGDAQGIREDPQWGQAERETEEEERTGQADKAEGCCRETDKAQRLGKCVLFNMLTFVKCVYLYIIVYIYYTYYIYIFQTTSLDYVLLLAILPNGCFKYLIVKHSPLSFYFIFKCILLLQLPHFFSPTLPSALYTPSYHHSPH